MHSLLLWAAMACGLALSSGPALAETAPTTVDEGIQDPSLVEMRQRLIRIFETRNRAALTHYLHPGIVVGSGVIGAEHVRALDAEEARGYADRLKAGGRFARPGLFFVFYDAQEQRKADFRLDETNQVVHSLHGVAAVRIWPNERARKLNKFGLFKARLLPSPPGTPSDWAYVQHDEPNFDWSKGYIRKRDLANQNTDGVLILLKLEGRWWVVRMCIC